MSVHAISYASPNAVRGLGALVTRLLALKAPHDNHANELAGLSDRLLLDIGIDPRDVQNNDVNYAAQPDVLDAELTIVKFRTAAKS
ncbi:MAG: hypothetical protein ACRCU5_12635 [Rhizobiaceae bacterium]